MRVRQYAIVHSLWLDEASLDDAEERITAMAYSPLVPDRWDGDSVAVRLICPA